MQFLQDQSRQLTAQIKAFGPRWHYDEIGPTDALGAPVVALQGLSSKVADLRFQRAAVFARVKNDYGPLKVETLRLIQQRADGAYDDAVALLKAGRLTPRLSDRKAVGNYIDREVRRDLRTRYNQPGIDSSGKGPVRMNRREDDRSGNDLTYQQPDARVKDVAFDVTLTRKRLGTAQVRGFSTPTFNRAGSSSFVRGRPAPTIPMLFRVRRRNDERNKSILQSETIHPGFDERDL